MRSIKSLTVMVGILAALTAGTLLTSAKAFADAPKGEKPAGEGCCATGHCDARDPKDVAGTPPPTTTPVVVPAGKVNVVDPASK